MGNLPFALVIVLGFFLLVLVVFLLVLPIWFIFFSSKRLQEITAICKEIKLLLEKKENDKKIENNKEEK